MSAPSWPRLAGWLATREPPSCTGRWRLREDGVERTGAFAHRDGDWAVTDDAGGEAPRSEILPLVSRLEPHAPDFTVAAGPPVAGEHDGRPAWVVELLPPPHKRGRLRLVVDAELRVAVAAENAAHGFRVEVHDLRLGTPPDHLFTAVRRREEDDRSRARLHALLLERPAPTPRWFPDRRSYVERDDAVTVEGMPSDGLVARGPLDRPPPLPDEYSTPDAVRLTAHGWSWVVARRGGIDAATARAVVDAVQPAGD